ncbi:hypothetical protein MYU51_017415 [Penicillium brevicompactum]
MACSACNHNEILQPSEIEYSWSTIDLNGWRTDFLKQAQAFYMSSSPEPPFTTKSSTHELQLPSTPNSQGRVPCSCLTYSGPNGTIESIKGIDPEPFVLQRNDVAISPPSSRELRDPRLWDNLVTQNSTTAQPTGSINPCAAKCKPPRSSRISSSKSKTDHKYGTFKCEWEGCSYDRMFSRKGVLMRHIAMQHVNPQSFKCPSCDHATSRRENLKAHRLAIHNERL